MSRTHIIETIEHLRQELDVLRPLKKEDEDRLWKKFRLEWNYNSNHIEGNTLSYGETELLLIFGKTTGDHTLREYEEMKAHDVAVAWLRDLAGEEEDRFNEAFIRELNRLILKEPYYKAAITRDGKPTQKQIVPGEYKTSLNSVRLQNGEEFRYASPEETPAKMGDLVQWYRGEIENGSKHSVQIAAELHYRFVLIHPFDDGNGRVARLLMNYVLMRAGYPPVIILSKDKKGYLDALNKMDTGVDRHALRNYIANRLVWSFETSIKAAKGEDIEEEDDLDKEIEVWSKGARAEKATKATNEIIQQLFNAHVKEFVNSYCYLHTKFSLATSSMEVYYSINKMNLASREEFDKAFNDYSSLYNAQWKASKKKPIMKKAEGWIVPLPTKIELAKITIELVLRQKETLIHESYFSDLAFEFGEYSYNIYHNYVPIGSMEYGDPWSQENSHQMLKSIKEVSFNGIKQLHKQINLDT